MTDLVWNPVKIKLGKIIKWEDNPRMSTKAQAQRLIKSERELGQIQTVAISPPDGNGFVNLYDGHQRISAWFTVKGADCELNALQSNRHLTEDERKKVSVLLHTATGSWDWNSLSSWSPADLNEWGMDKDTLKGWQSDAKELTELLKSEVETVDAEPQIETGEAIEKWGVKKGDLFSIGKHKLLCGDSTNRLDIEKLTEGKPFCVLTDPPYNIGFNYNGIDDEMSIEEYRSFCKNWFQVVSDAECVIFSPGPKNTRLYPEPRDIGFWQKRNASAGASAFNLRTIEPILIYGKIGKKRNFDVFDYSSGFPDELKAARCAASVSEKHPPAKPIELWIELMTMLPDFPIVDCFSGNGTSFMAAEKSNRVCYGNEYDTSYCALILERLSTAFPHLEIKRING